MEAMAAREAEKVAAMWVDILWCSCPPPIAVLLVDSNAHHQSSSFMLDGRLGHIQPPLVGFECKDIKDHQHPSTIIHLVGFDSDYLF